MVAGAGRPVESFHLRSNHLVSFQGENASMVSHGYAWNKDGSGGFWEVWGIYEHGFERTAEGWRINRFVFRMTHERGERL